MARSSIATPSHDLDRPVRSRIRPAVVLAYHGVSDVPLSREARGLFVRPRDVRRHVARLRAWGYELVTFADLAARAADGRHGGCAALTFDDGFVDNLECLAPLLFELRVPATAFVVSGSMGRPHPDASWTRSMTPEEVRHLHDVGIEVGSQSHTGRALASLPYREALDDLLRSRLVLEDLLAAPVEVAAYPYGSASRSTVEACRQAGFRAACRTGGLGSWSEPFALPRQDVRNRKAVRIWRTVTR